MLEHTTAYAVAHYCNKRQRKQKWFSLTKTTSHITARWNGFSLSAWTSLRNSKSKNAAKNVFAGVFTQIESLLFSSEKRYRDSESHYFHGVFSLYANRNKASKVCCAFLFSFGLTFLRVVSQFSPGLPFAVDRSLRESPTPFFHGYRSLQFQAPQF